MQALLLAGLMLMPGAAWSKDVPGNRSTTVTITPVGAQPESDTAFEGVFETPNDSDWYRVRLQAGQEIAVGTLNYGDTDHPSVLVRVRDQRGKDISRDFLASAIEFDGGSWARATYTGWYYVEVTEDASFGPAPGYPYSYSFAVSPDCGADTKTSCKIKVGATQQKWLVTEEDVDWLAAQLTAGKVYDVTAIHGPDAAISPEILLGILSPKGKVLVGGVYGLAEIRGFRPPTTGTYYIRVLTGEDYGTQYRVTLSASRP